MSGKKTEYNTCQSCRNTHEDCADSKSCPKWRISLGVCEVFGTRPAPLPFPPYKPRKPKV